MSFERIDKHAYQVSSTDEATFESLIDYLERGITPYDDRELLMARALIIWFFMKHKEPESVDDSTSDCPLALIRNLKRKELTFSKVYKTLCSKARLECKIIKGISRSGDYQAGDIDSRKLTATWNAVRISGQWRLVYPRWVVQSVTGIITKGILLEAEGKKVNKGEERCVGKLQKDFNDFWFLTNPVVFANKCLPNEPKWQLLPMDKIQKSKLAFLKQPNYTEWAYKYGIRLVRKTSCLLYSDNGFCLIELRAESESSMMELSLSSKLKLLSVKGKYNTKNNHSLIQYFPPTLAKKTAYGFNIRFPVEGKYNFEVSAGPRKDRSIRHKICDFMIVCMERMRNFKPLPIETGETGWAPGPDAVDAGLTEPSVTEPSVKIKPMSEENVQLQEEANTNALVDAVAEFVFKVEKGVWDLHDYETVMFGSDFVEKEKHKALQENVKTVNDKRNCTLNIRASVPQEGEYALVIKTVPKRDAQEAKPVCNYMLTTLDCSSDEIPTDDSDYSSDEEFKDLKLKIQKLKEKKQRLQETRNKMLEKIQ